MAVASASSRSGGARGAVGLLHRHRRQRAGDGVQRRFPTRSRWASRLYTQYFVSGVTVAELSPLERARLFNNELRSQDSATSARQPARARPRSRASEPADRPPLRRRAGDVRAARGASPRAGRSSRPARCRRTRTTCAPASRTQYVAARRDRRRRPDATIAGSVRQTRRASTRASYPFGPLFAAPIGYYDPTNGRDRARGSTATACWPARRRSRARSLDQLEGKRTERRRGRHDARRARAAGRLPGARRARRRGRRDGARAPARSGSSPASPTYDPNEVAEPRRVRAVINDDHHGAAARPRHRSRSTRPGSTFKVVTAIAAIDTGKYTPNSVAQRQLADRRLRPAAGQRQRHELRRGVAQRRADATRSTPSGRRSRWASARRRSRTYMDRLGFYRTPPIDLPSDELAVSGVRYPGRRGYLPLTGGADIGRVGIGEGGLEVTPLQMADGRLGRRQRRPADGPPPHQRDRQRRRPDCADRHAARSTATVMKPSTAQEVGAMMENVVNATAPARQRRSRAITRRRQDRHRPGLHEPGGLRHQPGLVHRLRARRATRRSRSR